MRYTRVTWWYINVMCHTAHQDCRKFTILKTLSSQPQRKTAVAPSPLAARPREQNVHVRIGGQQRLASKVIYQWRTANPISSPKKVDQRLVGKVGSYFSEMLSSR